MADAVQHNRPLVAVGAEAHAMRFIGRFMPWLGRLIARLNMAAH